MTGLMEVTQGGQEARRVFELLPWELSGGKERIGVPSI